MNKLDVFMDLNRRHANGDIFSSDYREALEILQNLPEGPEIAPKRLFIRYNDVEGLKIVKPIKEPFSVRQRYCMKMARYGLVGFVVLVLALLQSCGSLL